MNIDERIEALQMNIESLHTAVGELVEESQGAQVERHNAQVAEILAASKQDGKDIRALARIAEIRVSRIEREPEA